MPKVSLIPVLAMVALLPMAQAQSDADAQTLEQFRDDLQAAETA